MKAFTFTSMPFVVAETATGVLSLAVGEFSIPPMIGLGTAVDAAILLAGLVASIVRALKTRESKSEG